MQAQQWFAFPPLKACFLAKQLSCHPMDLLAHGGTVHADALLYPASTTWPMGFSWSSAIAQDTTLGILEASGLPRTQVLANSHPVPRDQSELAIVATGAAKRLWHGWRSLTRRWRKQGSDAQKT